MGNQNCSLTLLDSDGTNNVDKDESYFQLTADATLYYAVKPNMFYFYIYPRRAGSSSTYVDSLEHTYFTGKKTITLPTVKLNEGTAYFVKWFHGPFHSGELLCQTEIDFTVISKRGQAKLIGIAQYQVEMRRRLEKAQKEKDEAILIAAVRRQQEIQNEENKIREERKRRDRDEASQRERLVADSKRRREASHASEMQSTMNQITVQDRRLFKKYFDVIDTDLNGDISVDELYNYFNTIGNFSRQQVQELMDEADLNKDHVIRIDEFITICKLSSSNPRTIKNQAWDELEAQVRREYHDNSPRYRAKI